MIGLKYPKLVYSRSFKMNQQQSHKESSFYVGWEVHSYTIILSLQQNYPEIGKNKMLRMVS